MVKIVPDLVWVCLWAQHLISSFQFVREPHDSFVPLFWFGLAELYYSLGWKKDQTLIVFVLSDFQTLELDSAAVLHVSSCFVANYWDVCGNPFLFSVLFYMFLLAGISPVFTGMNQSSSLRRDFVTRFCRNSPGRSSVPFATQHYPHRSNNYSLVLFKVKVAHVWTHVAIIWYF